MSCIRGFHEIHVLNSAINPKIMVLDTRNYHRVITLLFYMLYLSFKKFDYFWAMYIIIKIIGTTQFFENFKCLILKPENLVSFYLHV